MARKRIDPERLKWALREQGLTQAALAAALEIRPPSVSEWIRGKSSPSAPRLQQLAQLLSVSTAWLAGAERPAGEGRLPSLTATALDIAEAARALATIADEGRDASPARSAMQAELLHGVRLLLRAQVPLAEAARDASASALAEAIEATNTAPLERAVARALPALALVDAGRGAPRLSLAAPPGSDLSSAPGDLTAEGYEDDGRVVLAMMVGDSMAPTLAEGDVAVARLVGRRIQIPRAAATEKQRLLAAVPDGSVVVAHLSNRTDGGLDATTIRRIQYDERGTAYLSADNPQWSRANAYPIELGGIRCAVSIEARVLGRGVRARI